MTPATIKSAQRTLRIFELFAELRRPARVAELFRRLDLPQSSTSKLLRSFAKLGYLQYDGEQRTYYPTLRITLLGSWLHDQWFGHDSLLATMESLRSTLGTSVLLGIQNDKHVLYMVALQALVAPRPALSIGTLRPICVAAAGKALMMGKTDYEIGLLVRRINSEEPDPTRYINLAEFLTDIEQCRTRGYALSDGAVMPGTGVVAMPLPRLPGQPAMVLGVGATLEWLRPNLNSVVDALRNKLTALAADTQTQPLTPMPGG
ncbi:IclR family transcriptional regulator (plasmid) [Sphingomonas paeninsulae]|uniref:IclR family transcriptional regulator n=1 Tax=Sphingomonas paeninsulae TaxID=2319844 RepID=A0A494TGC7_SPHPE|nr:helix-turn-helix domain-containing protein [Sphingomonas paeninsulae]AYJ84871.1 IclR family transcriptional regulator [Sphingomonas paeninsulae]